MATTPTTPAVSSADSAAAAWDASAPPKTDPTPATPPAAVSTPATPAVTTPPATPPADVPAPDAAGLDGLSDLLKDDLAPIVDPAAPVVTDPLEALKDNPRVQELVKTEQSVTEAMKLSEYLKEPAHLADAVRDADIVWKISDGKENVSVILEAARERDPQKFQKILSDFKAYYEQVTGQQLAAGAAGLPPAQTPEQKQLADIQKELTDRKNAEAQAATNKRIATAKTSILESINTSVKGTWLDGEGEYLLGLIGAKLGADKTMQVVEAAEKGDFNAINKALRAVKNEEAIRVKARIDRMVAAKKAKAATIPTQVSGSTPALPADPTAPVVEMDAEKRRANMVAQLRS